MRKIWNKIRKIFVSIGLALFALKTSGFASNLPDVTGPMYGVQPVKPKEPSFLEKTLPIIKFVLIPLLLLIGLIIYWKKSKAEKKKKIYVTVVIILLGVGIYAIINWIENAGL